MHLGPEWRPATLANLPLCQLITLIGLSTCSKKVFLATLMM